MPFPVQDLKLLGSCPICKQKYSPAGVLVLTKEEDFLTAHVTCEKCQSSVLVAISFGMLGVVTTVGMLTDVSREDIRHLQEAEPITSDDVLELHTFLERRRAR